MFKKDWGDFSLLNVIFRWSLSLNQIPEREKRRASFPEREKRCDVRRKQLGSHVLWLAVGQGVSIVG